MATTAKLDVIARYLASYTTALKEKPSKEHPFVKGYIDAFAGTGHRNARRDDRSGDVSQALLLPDFAEAEPQALLDGSARLALKPCLVSTATCSSSGVWSVALSSDC